MPIGHGGAVQWSTIAEPEAKMVRVLFVVGGLDGWLVGLGWMAGCQAQFCFMCWRLAFRITQFLIVGS